MNSEISTCVPTGIKIEETGFGYTLSLIGGKYKMIILHWIMENEVMWFNELQRSIGSISHKSLSVILKQLQADGLIHRKEYPQIPPKVEYSLTEKAETHIPIFHQLCEWGKRQQEI